MPSSAWSWAPDMVQTQKNPQWSHSSQKQIKTNKHQHKTKNTRKTYTLPCLPCKAETRQCTLCGTLRPEQHTVSNNLFPTHLSYAEDSPVTILVWPLESIRHMSNICQFYGDRLIRDRQRHKFSLFWLPWEIMCGSHLVVFWGPYGRYRINLLFLLACIHPEHNV